MEIADKVIDVVAHLLEQPADALRSQMDEDLEGLGLDSHGLVRLGLDLEQAFGVTDLEIPDDALESLNELIAFCGQLKKS